MKRNSNSIQLPPLETALQKQFKADAGIVRKAFDLVEENRAAFAANALKFGLCALAAKSIVGHGKFGKWLSEALSDGGNVRPIAERTAKDYIGLAKVFIEKLSIPNKLPVALSEGIDDVCGRYAIARNDFNINEFLADHEKTTELLDSTVRGMTLTQLRQLLREGAERAYSDEQAEQSKPQPKNNLRGLQSGNAGGGQSAQMLLWEDWTNNLAEFDKLTKHKDIVRLPLEKLVLIERSLEDRLDEIKNLIKHCGE